MSEAARRAQPAHELDSFFSPSSIAVVGASPDATKIRGLLLSMLRKNGYPGQIFPINPSYPDIDGLRCYPSIAAIGQPIDLALIAIPANAVLASLEECAAAGVRHAVIISSGFAEEGGASAQVQVKIAELARRTGMRISGPNAEGFHNEPGRVSATFSPAVESKPGETRAIVSKRRIGVIAQSGGIGFALYDRGKAAALNFSTIISTGNESDLTASDFLDYMIQDSATDVVMMFLESVRDPETFLAAAQRAAASGKPVIVSKVGRSGAGERAAASHTASMTGWNAAYEAVFAKYGFIQANDPDDAVAIAAALTTAPLPKGDRVAIVTVSGGGGAWMADTLASFGLSVPELSAGLQQQIRALIPSYGSASNPIDITAQGIHTGGLQKSIELLTESDEVDLIIVVTSLSNEKRVPLDMTALKRVVDAQKKPLMFYTYTLPSQLGRATLATAGVAVYPGLSTLATAVHHLVRRGKFRAPNRPAAARAPVRLPANMRHSALSEYDTKTVLRQFGIALPTEQLVGKAEDLDTAMRAVGFPLVMKIQSPDIPHKSEAGGVRLGIVNAQDGRAAYETMLSDVRRLRPDATLQGVLLSPMAPRGVEIIIGAIRDAVFGPMIMVGLGGVTTELFKDIVYRPAPVSQSEAAAMVESLRAAPLLNGFRGAPRADVAALTKLIADISSLAAALGDDLGEIELNPVIVHRETEGITVVDALLIPPGASRGHSAS